jgi:hypothetical protein
MKERILKLIDRNKRHDRSASVLVPVRCSICRLPAEERRAVDNALAEEGASLGVIAKRLGISRSSVCRHAKHHLMPAVREQLRAAIASKPGALEVTQTIKDLRNLDARAEVSVLYQKVKDILAKAEDANDFMAMKAFLSEGRQCLDLMGRWDGAFLDLRNQVNVQIIQLATPSDASVTGIGDTIEISRVPEE